MKFEAFGEYWFGMFGVVAVLDQEGDGEGGLSVDSERDWGKECLGTFYVKPNYPGMPQYLPVVLVRIGQLMRKAGARTFAMQAS